ncbi:flagellar protein [Neorhizobium sp. S3-V5DH]|jgi:hypothetical protein|uniref:flagellar protein n=1 Tax=Neorhizobium sp. S3-V5DH TaxID=2485166 RepID=UPI000DD7A1A6|nr:flagellar protein [Neorhizobium sp. S3-V5DH]TCV76065.1 hypothetical protein EDE09_101351 [Neorhizobium sp. S3-V5DH]
MSDLHHEDEAVPPHRTPKAASRLGDKILIAVGVALAAASASFPWYVFFNEEKFGIRTTELGRTRDLPPGAGRPVVNVSPLAMTDSSKEDWPAPPEPTDALTTATTSSVGEARDRGAFREEQPFPGKSGFKLLHVANGRALIEDGAGMYMVRVGSILPDNSKLATLEQRDGKWVIITSTGQVYQDTQTSRP